MCSVIEIDSPSPVNPLSNKKTLSTTEQAEEWFWSDVVGEELDTVRRGETHSTPIRYEVVEEVEVANALRHDGDDNLSWQCWGQGRMIPTQDMRLIIMQLRTTHTGAHIMEPCEFESLVTRGHDKSLTTFASPVVAITLLNRHFITICFSPAKSAITYFDSLENHAVEGRKKQLSDFADWLFKHGHESEACVNGKSQQQRPASNDCGIFAINNAVLFLTGAFGRLNREQIRLKSLSHKYQFVFGPQRILLDGEPCNECGHDMLQNKVKGGGIPPVSK